METKNTLIFFREKLTKKENDDSLCQLPNGFKDHLN